MASEKKLRDALIDKNLFFAAAQPRVHHVGASECLKIQHQHQTLRLGWY